MKRRHYFDKYGKQVKAGDFIRFYDGSVEEIFECGDDELGINATSKEYLKYHPDAPIECYPLWQFNHNDYELVTNKEV